jgi:hypothetical protein
VCAGSGEAFNVGRFLEETSPYLWASTGIGLCIGFSVLGAGWCVHNTQNHHRCAWRDLVCSLISLSFPSQGHLRHWLIHPRRWCQGPPHTDQESHQVCIDPCSFHETQPAKVSTYMHTVSSSAKSWQSMAWCVGPLPLPRAIFSFSHRRHPDNRDCILGKACPH